MPSKGIANPCNDPLGKGHKKRSRYKDVKNCKASFLSLARQYLPECNWLDNTRMCSSCRGIAYKRIEAKKEEIRTQDVNRNDNVNAEMEQEAPADDGYSENPVFCDDAESNAAGMDPLNGTEYTLESSEGENESLEPQHLTQKEQSTLATPDVSPSSSVFVTPSLPSRITCSRNKVPKFVPSTPCSSRQAELLSDISPSLTSSIVIPSPSISVQSGSVFHDEQTAKADLRSFLQNIGIAMPERTIRSRRSISEIMGKATDVMRSLFSEYAGECLNEESVRCECPHCLTLQTSVKEKLKTVNSKKEEYMMLTSLPGFIGIQEISENYGVSSHVARNVSLLRAKNGPFSFPIWKSSGNPLAVATNKVVNEFFNSDDNSRVSPNARDTIDVVNLEGVKERVPKRLMSENLKDTYKEFKRQYPDVKIGISKFAELRPKNCTWPGQKGFHISCTCVIHQNFKLMLEGLKNASLEEIENQFEGRPTAVSYLAIMENYKELIEYVSCSPPTEDCFLGYCEMCPIEVHLQELFGFSCGSDISYKFWELNDISTRIDNHTMFTTRFVEQYVKFLSHEFIYQEQKQFIKERKSGSLDNGTTGVLTVDFGENYSFVVQNAIQGYHWNNKMATIHPFVLYTSKDDNGRSVYKTYFVISNEMNHDATSFHAFRVQVIAKIKEDFPRLVNIDYVSDGASSQYKNYKNVGNLIYHEDDFNLTARWIFTATSHGKSTCDAMSAVVKRAIRLRSLQSEVPITTPERMFEVASAELSSPTLEFLYVTTEDVTYWRGALSTRYSTIRKIPHIRKCHFLSVGPNKLLISKRYATSETYETHDIITIPLEREELTGRETETITSDIPLIGEFYAIQNANKFQVGYILDVNEKDKLCSLRMMKKAGRGGVALMWPPVDKVQEINYQNILTKIQVPSFIETAQNYRINQDDLIIIRSELERRMS